MIRKERSLVSLSAPTLLTSRDARVRSAAGFGGAPAPATRGRAVMTSILRPHWMDFDGGVWIDVDAPARAIRRAEALASIRKREAAIHRALCGGSPAPPPWREIAIRHSPVDRPALAPAFGTPAAEAGHAAETSRPVRARRSTAVTARGEYAPQPCSASVDALPAADCPRGLIPDVAAVFPNLTFGFTTALLGCSMLAWATIWVVLRFCQ
jgi:hypothetical protein